MDDVFFAQKHFDFHEALNILKNFCHEYLSNKDKDELHQKILSSFPYFYKNKDCFKDLAEFFADEGLEEFKIRAENVYCGHLAVKIRDGLVKMSEDCFHKNYENFINEIKTKSYKKIFQHYVEINALFYEFSTEGLGINKNIDRELSKLTSPMSWNKKRHVYSRKIREIIKFNARHTKSSVIIISNNSSSDILEGLREIHSQRQKVLDYKIIFVSNNEDNCVAEVLGLVDTFILMRGNDGAYLARNVGSVFAVSDLLIFLEDDGIPEDGFVKAHEDMHGANVAAVRGAYLTKSNGMMPNWYWLGSQVRPCQTNLEGNCSFDAKRFYEVGGWGDYVFFGHGGYEICHRMLQVNTSPEMHMYSPGPKIYHDYCTKNKNLDNKKLAQHASWQVLKFSYDDFHTIKEKWSTINDTDYFFKIDKIPKKI